MNYHRLLSLLVGGVMRISLFASNNPQRLPRRDGAVGSMYGLFTLLSNLRNFESLKLPSQTRELNLYSVSPVVTL
jgi:hypothetical protein